MNARARAALVEMVGSFCFFFIGAGAIVTDSFTRGAVGLLGVALAHGIMLSIMVSAFGALSGAHFNPAVTIGLWVGKKVDFKTVVYHIPAQLIGGVLAGILLRMIFPPTVWEISHLGTPALAVGISPFQGLLVEAVLTAFLMFAVFGTAVDANRPRIGGFGIGLTVLVDILVGGPLTGAGMNPARVFGPGLVAGFWENHWIYWVGPIIGASAASWIYTKILTKTA